MDRLLLHFISVKPSYPVWVRYLLSLGLVGLAFLTKLLLDDQLKPYPLLLFIPAIFLASVIFDRGSGFLATGASAALALRYFMPPPLSAEILPLLIFLISGLSIAAVTEALRTTLEKHSEAKAYADVLLMELAHRTRNDLATIMSILRLQARSDSNPAVQAAIASALARIEVVAKVHDRLRNTSADSTVDLSAYLEALCGSLADFHRGLRPIAIRVTSDEIAVKSSQAASIGLIVNELVTNAFKYAFPDGRPGTVEVDVRSRNEQVAITVRDDGIGCPFEAKSGLGTRLINLMTAQMKGSMIRTPMAKGCEVEVVVNLED
ncbi:MULTISPECIES: sensor histidine kinase [Bradyrhizobium]|uniref:sensor histidine kinase n=1 Tax=Bradyrhizobium pachyrhizi TaxID=280333 RepID=UPI0004809FE8